MENRVVALAVLENLIHWPLPNRSGYAAVARGSGEDDEGGSATEALVSAGDAEDLSREPRQRKQDRYRAVLLLPHLCHRLGSRWAETEIVPYLLRCVEEDDPQLALVAGMALLGVTLPRRAPLGPTISSSSSSSPGASSTFNSAVGNNFGAFLSVEDVQPVCLLLASSSAEETRQFAAQVVLPHLFFGVALERDMTLESWDLKYVPISVLQADMTTTATSMDANEAAEYLESEDSNPSWTAGAVDKRDTDDGASSTSRLMAAVRKQLLRKHRLTMKARAAAARASSTVSGRDSNTSSSATDVTDPPAPTEEDVRKRCYALALEDESVQFLWSGAYAALTGPWLFDGSGPLASLCNDASDACGRCRSGSAASASRGMASFRCFRRHRRRVDNGQTIRAEPPAACLPLSGADLDLYGAAYASDADSGSGDDFFSVNVRARALVAGLVRWMDALGPPAPAATVTSPSTDADTSRSARLHADGSLSLFDYLCCDERRDVLRCRWRSLIKMLQGFLESPYPGPVAAAVETVSGLLHTIQAALWEVEQQQQQQRAKSSSAGSRAAHLKNKATSIDADAEVDAWSGIRVPAEPLLTTAELQMFLHRMTRRHVAYCVAAAVSARTVSMPPSPTSTSMKVLTDSIGRLMRSALVTAQRLLADLLLRHHVLMKLDVCSAAASTTTLESPHHRLGLDASCMMLQVGVGPSESRLASYSAWDVSFACASTTAGAATAATPNMPDDATFLMTTTPAAGGGTEKGSAKWLPGTLNAVSVFRLHRLVRRALLRALPLCVDFPCILHSCASTRALSNASTSGTSAPVAGVFSLSAVCPMLLQVLVPPSALPPLLNVLRVTVQLQHQVEKDHGAAEKHAGEAAASTPSSRHVDPAGTTMTAPALWAAMTAAGSVLELDTAAAEAPSRAEESPASVDFALLEAALDAVQRLTAEAAVQLSAAPQAGSLLSTSTPASVADAPPSHILDAVCAQLFILLAATLRWVPRYINWKARWLIAQRLPRLTATFCLLIVRVSSLAEGAAVSPAPGPTAHHLRAQIWLGHTLHLLTSLWTCAAQFGTAPLHDLVDDEEVEVRSIAARCAAQCFGSATEAVLRLSSSAGAGDEKARAKACVTSQQSSLLPSLRKPLLQLLDAIAQCVLAAASDSDTRVLCRSAEALAGLSRTLSLLVVADPSPLTRSASSTSTRNDEEPPVWARYLHSNTNTLLRLMTGNRPTVQLALVSQLTDFLLMRMRTPPHAKRQGQPRNGRAQGQLMGGEGDASPTCGPDGDGEEGRENDADAPYRSPDEVQYDALLQCLRQLSQHDLWRLREQYALLLAHLCGSLLLTTAAASAPASHGRHANVQWISFMDFSAVNARRVSGEGGTDETTRGSVTDAALMAQQGGEDAALWAHTHPLYQLARTELLTLLVAVLFDKVKAVRDAALDAVERMCVRLALASSRSAPGTGAGGGGGGTRQGSAGRQFGAGYDTEGVDTSADAVAAASGSLNANTFVDDVLWPRIYAYAPAWETYLSRSALLRIAMRLRVDKTSTFIPLLDQLARDPVLNVRLMVAKIILEVLLVSSPEVHAMTTPAQFLEAKDGEATTSGTSTPTPTSSYKPELPSGTIAYSILMNKPVPPLLAGSGSRNGRAAASADAVLPPLQFDEMERAGVILQILRQLLKDPSSDVRDEAAKALKGSALPAAVVEALTTTTPHHEDAHEQPRAYHGHSSGSGLHSSRCRAEAAARVSMSEVQLHEQVRQLEELRAAHRQLRHQKPQQQRDTEVDRTSPSPPRASAACAKGGNDKKSSEGAPHTATSAGIAADVGAKTGDSEAPAKAMCKSNPPLALPSAAPPQLQKYEPSQRPLQLPRPPPRLSLEHLHHDIVRCASDVKRLMEDEYELGRVVREALLELLGMEGSHVGPPLRLRTEDTTEVTASPFCAGASASTSPSSSVERANQHRRTHDAGPRSMRACDVDGDANSSQPTWVMPWLQRLKMEQEKQLRQMREMLVVARRSISHDSSDEGARAYSLMRTTGEARDDTSTAEPPHALLWQRHRCLLSPTQPDRPEAVEACSTLLAMQETMQAQSTQLARLEELLQETLITDMARYTSHGAGALPFPSSSAHRVEAAAAARGHPTVHRPSNNDTVLPTVTHTAASSEKNVRRSLPSRSSHSAGVPAAATAAPATTSSRVSTCVSAPSPPPVSTPKNARSAAAFTDPHTRARKHQQNQRKLDAIHREIADLCHFLRETLTQHQAQPTPQPHNPFNKTGIDARVNGQPSASMRESNSQYASAHALQWQPHHGEDSYLQEASRRQQHPWRNVSRSHTASGYPSSFSMHTEDST